MSECTRVQILGCSSELSSGDGTSKLQEMRSVEFEERDIKRGVLLSSLGFGGGRGRARDGRGW